MSGWIRTNLGDLPVYQAKTISWLPDTVQAFTTRQGGVGAAPYDTLNLSERCGDDPGAVAENRARLAAALRVDARRMVYAEQVHGGGVAVVTGEERAPVAGVDALVTDVPGVVLTLLFADCYPVYFLEPMRRIVALAHSGWRGTAANIVQRTTDALKQRFGVDPRMCQVAIGPGIAAENYVVGRDVADQFRSARVSTSMTPVMPHGDFDGKWELNLRAVLFSQLLAAGYKAASIAVCDEDTFANSRDFFSHRRESISGRSTGRMAAVMGLGERS